jgi:glycine dehydrogenase subunit 2
MARWASNTTVRSRWGACARSTETSECSSARWPTFFANGPDGLRQTTEDAVLNANYIRKGLEGVYDLPYSTPTMHEVVFSDKLQAKKGVKTMDIAKRLIDYGFHPYTTAFPLIVPGALMIEPTESEPKEEMDPVHRGDEVDRGRSGRRSADVLDAPHSTRISRLDETAAARKPVLRWKPRRTGCRTSG